MKRVFISSYSYLPTIGGVERVVDNFSRSLLQSGHRPLLVTNAHPEKKLGLAHEAGVPVLRLPIPTYFDRQRKDAVRHFFLDALNLMARTFAVMGQRTDVVHAHHLNIDANYCLWLQRYLGLPFVMSLHGGETDLWIARNPHRVPFIREVLYRADRITGVSQTLLDRAERLAPGIAAKASVVRNAIDAVALRKLAFSGKSPLPSPGPHTARVVCLAQLVPWKSLDTAIRAFHELKESGRDLGAELVIVGDGPEREKLQALAKAGQSGCQFTGPLSYADTLAVLKEASVLLLPSLTEGCPKVLLEARTFGVPVIVSDAPSLLELVEDGVDGLVVPREDPGALANAIARLLQRPDLANHIAAAGYRRLEEHHPDRIMAQYLALYESIRRQGPIRTTAAP